MGNERSNNHWEAELPPNYVRVVMENFIRAKYDFVELPVSLSILFLTLSHCFVHIISFLPDVELKDAHVIC